VAGVYDFGLLGAIFSSENPILAFILLFAKGFDLQKYAYFLNNKELSTSLEKNMP